MILLKYITQTRLTKVTETHLIYPNTRIMNMTIDDIKKLIASDELRTLEQKKSTGELKDGMHSACAFLNTEGGWSIFGVAPSSLKIIGQEVTDKT